MKVNENSSDITLFVKSVMAKIQAISEHVKTGSTELIEEYYREHKTYNGIEKWLKSFGKNDDD